MGARLTRTRGQACASDLYFDRYLGGELAQSATSALELHVSACADCDARLRQLQAARAAFSLQGEADWEALQARLRAPVPGGARQPAPVPGRPSGLRARMQRWPRPLYVAWASAAVALCAVVALSVFPPDPDDGLGTAAGLRSKGATRLSFHVLHGQRVREGAPGERLSPGDRVRFSVRVERPAYVTVLALDGAGHANVYYPPGERAARVSPGSLFHLPASVALDNVLGPERWVALFCEVPAPLEPMRAALERQARGFVAPPGCAAQIVDVEKVP